MYPINMTQINLNDIMDIIFVDDMQKSFPESIYEISMYSDICDIIVESINTVFYEKYETN